MLVALLHTGTRQPDRERSAVVVTTRTRILVATLAVGGATELGHEDDQRVLEHAPDVEVLEDRGRGLVE